MTDEQNATELSKPKLLLADDSVTIRKVVELTFADEGVDVTTVGTGEEAMLKFVEIGPDIVLVDVNMPDPTGYQICEMIKQDESTRHIPVILLVGSFEPFDQDEAERVGADGFVVKPFQSIRELVAKVRELLGPDKEPVVVTPETTDIDNLYVNSFAETYKMGDSEGTDIFLGDAGMDDQIIETSHPSNDGIVPVFEPAVEADETLRGFDWSASPVEEPEPVVESRSNGGFEPRFIIEEDEPIDAVIDIEEEEPIGNAIDEEAEVDTLRDMDVDEPVPENASVGEPSDEFVTLVARLVIEKLSDRVIREIARDAVPRIAENLIREALEEENKS